MSQQTSRPGPKDVDAVFDALAHEARRHIIALLAHRGGELPSGYLASRFKHSWPTTTRHLKVLEDAGIVEVRREGRSAMYRLVRERLDGVVGGWLRQVVPADPSARWTSSGPSSVAALAARSVPPRPTVAPPAQPAARPARRTRTTDPAIRSRGAPPP